MNDLSAADFTQAVDPFALFELVAEARAAEINDPEAMTLATVERTACPTRAWSCARAPIGEAHLLHQYGERQGTRLAGQPRAAALFHWKSLRRQARFRGPVAQVTAAESDAYFASRPRGSQIGAWASQQSRALGARADLEAAVGVYERRFGTGDVPRPDYWRGYRLSRPRSSSGAIVPPIARKASVQSRDAGGRMAKAHALPIILQSSSAMISISPIGCRR